MRRSLAVFACMYALGLARAAAAAAEAPTVAVLYFDYEGKDAEQALLRKGLAQMLISDLLGNEWIRVVERDRLQEVIAELKLQATNKMDQATAERGGELLGARHLGRRGAFEGLRVSRGVAR